ncbi:hypothetical protein RJT34_32562 [Clitoria ternatea]|uniref:Uncharacterized protein n=1 Tax=Clitoria ternatea TaxID=43366 RepID=A0AAN9F493_CLITE
MILLLPLVDVDVFSFETTSALKPRLSEYELAQKDENRELRVEYLDGDSGANAESSEKVAVLWWSLRSSDEQTLRR